LAVINQRDGISVSTSSHTLDTARIYGRRIIGMGSGRSVYGDAPEHLTEPTIRGIYGGVGTEAVDEMHHRHQPSNAQ
jgi:ABC-type phosphate/phosphonate transport system ATPase subunit